MKWTIKIWLCLLFCVSCHPKDAPKEKKVVLLLDWYPNPIHIPLYAGIEKGFFVKEGIDLEILKLLEPPSSIPYLASKKVDIALYYLPQSLQAYEQVSSLKIIGKLIERPLQGFCFFKEANIKEMKDFHDKIIAGSPDGLTLRLLFYLEGKYDFKIREFKKVHFDLLSALLLKEADILSSIFWNIEPEKMKSLGRNIEYFSWEDFGIPSYPELVFLSRDDFLKKDPSFGKRFRSALEQSIEFTKNNPDQAWELYLHANSEKRNETSNWEKKAWDKTIPLLAENQKFDLEKMEKFISKMNEMNIFSLSKTFDSFLEPELIRECK